MIINKRSLFIIWSFLLTVASLTIYENRQAGQPAQTTDLAINNFDLSQIEIVQDNPDSPEAIPFSPDHLYID
jgi:hypothetical protein